MDTNLRDTPPNVDVPGLSTCLAWSLLSGWKYLVNLCCWFCIHGPKFSVVTYQVGIRKIIPSLGSISFTGYSLLVHFVEFQKLSKSIERQNWEFSIKYYSLISLVGCQSTPFCWGPCLCEHVQRSCVIFLVNLPTPALDCSRFILLLQHSGHCFVAILTDFRWLSPSKFRHLHYYRKTPAAEFEGEQCAWSNNLTTSHIDSLRWMVVSHFPN